MGTPRMHKQLEVQYPPELYFIRELSALKKAPSLQDPSMSPSWSSINVESLLRKLDKESNKEASPQVNEILQRFVCLKVGASRTENVAGTEAKMSGLKEGELYQSECGMDSSHGDTDKQLKATLTPSYHVKKGTSRVKGNASDCKSNRCSTGKVRRPLDTGRLSNTDEQQEGNKSLPLFPEVLESGNQRKQRPIEGAHGRLPHKKGRSPFSLELTAKSKPRNRRLRKGRGTRLRRSPSFQARRKVQEVLYTGLITPSRRRHNWRISPRNVDQPTSDTFGMADAYELEISELPRNGCGTPWSWSRFHHKRRHNILKTAGMGMPCGLSDSFTKNGGRGISSCESTSEVSETSFNTDSESLPLLEPSPLLNRGTQSDRLFWRQDAKELQDSFNMSSNNQGRKWIERHGVVSSVSENNHDSLNQKYMPKSFHDIVGQNLITQALCNALSRGKIAPMYIFYGPRGTGKTSCAKIFAAALNCLSSEGQRPCGTCVECTAGNNSMVKEFNLGGKNGTRGIKMLMHDVIWSSSSHYSVYVVNECHTLTNQSWNAFLKVVEEAPRNIVFILSTSNLEQLPHAIVSRCQKFLFSKIKENEIINRLQLIALQEGMEADAEAFRLIASTCDGSLRDAEMMLDQLSLLGQKISISIVQELMGLIPDDKLVDLLDFALSADTVNTVRNLKELMVSGAEPLNLMSQLACLITSILAGGYQIPTEMQRGKFFRQELSKEDMERLRQALKTLSEAEKQLRDSSDRTTWLTAALLQFAPDQSYLIPQSSSNTTVTRTSEGPSDMNGTPGMSTFSKKNLHKSQCTHTPTTYMESRLGTATECASNGLSDSSRFSPIALDQTYASASSQAPRTNTWKLEGLHSASSTGDLKLLSSSTQVDDSVEVRPPETTTLANQFDMEDVWQRFLDAVHSNSLRKFLMTQGKLVSLSLSKGFAVALLEFGQPEHTARAIRSRTSIAYAFHCTLGYPVDIKVCLAPAAEDHLKRQALLGEKLSGSNSLWHSPWSANAFSEPIVAEPEHGLKTAAADIPTFCMSSAYPLTLHESETGNSSSLQPLTTTTTKKKLSTENKRDAEFMAGSSKVAKHKDKGAASLGFVIRHAEDSAIEPCNEDVHDNSQRHEPGSSSLNIFRSGGSDFGYTMAQEAHSAMVAAQLTEEENMRLESKTGVLSCWSAADRGGGHAKVKQLQRTSKRSGLLLSLCPCAKSSHS